METSRATRESDEEQQCGEWQQTKRSGGGAHHEAEQRERRRAQGLDGARSEGGDAQREDTAAREKCRECEEGEREWEPVEEWGSEMLGERVGTRDVAIEPRLRDTRTEKRRAARRTRRRSARPKGEEGRECRGLTPLAPGPGDVDCSAANTHHSRNQAGVRGWGSRESVPLGVCTF